MIYDPKKKKKNHSDNMICDKCKIIFSPEHAAQGESSCSRTASDNWCTADPTPGLYRSESHLPEEREAPCCGRVLTFYGTGPEAAALCMKETDERKKIKPRSLRTAG